MRFWIAVLSPFVWLFCRLFFKIKFFGVENIPPQGACIITPNHVTYADPIWITIPVKRRIYYMAWDKPFRIPVLGLLMRMFGAFPVNLDVAADASAQREAIELLRNGSALVIFPEGGRTRTGKLMPFKMGAFRMALAHGVPIVPVSIEGGYEPYGPAVAGTAGDSGRTNQRRRHQIGSEGTRPAAREGDSRHRCKRARSLELARRKNRIFTSREQRVVCLTERRPF